MAVEADDGRTLEQRLRLIEDRFEIYNLIASHPPSADTGAGDYTASVRTEDACSTAVRSSTGRPGGRRSPARLRTPSTTGRSSRGSRILPACLCADRRRHGVRDFLFADPRAGPRRSTF